MKLGSKELSEVTGKSKEYWDDYLDKVNYSQMLVIVKDRELHFILPDPNTEEAERMKKEGEEGIVTIPGGMDE